MDYHATMHRVAAGIQPLIREFMAREGMDAKKAAKHFDLPKWRIERMYRGEFFEYDLATLHKLTHGMGLTFDFQFIARNDMTTPEFTPPVADQPDTAKPQTFASAFDALFPDQPEVGRVNGLKYVVGKMIVDEINLLIREKKYSDQQLQDQMKLSNSEIARLLKLQFQTFNLDDLISVASRLNVVIGMHRVNVEDDKTKNRVVIRSQLTGTVGVETTQPEGLEDFNIRLPTDVVHILEQKCARAQITIDELIGTLLNNTSLGEITMIAATMRQQLTLKSQESS